MKKNLNRRDFLGLIGSGVAALMLPTSATWCSTRKKPNFILIFADDLGYGDISGFGLKESPFKTPNFFILKIVFIVSLLASFSTSSAILL